MLCVNLAGCLWKGEFPIKERAEAAAGFHLKGYVEDSALERTFGNISFFFFFHIFIGV